MQAQSGAPNVSCALLLVQAPQHFTQVGCNFCIGAFFPGLQQQCASLFGLALAEQHPAQTVGDEGVAGCVAQGFFYQLLCLLEA